MSDRPQQQQQPGCFSCVKEMLSRAGLLLRNEVKETRSMLSDREGFSGTPQLSPFVVDRNRVRSSSTVSRLGLDETVSCRRPYASYSTASRLGRSPDDVPSYSSSDSCRARMPVVATKVSIICDDVVPCDSLIKTVCSGCKASSMFDDTVATKSNESNEYLTEMAGRVPHEACLMADLSTVAKWADIMILAVSSRVYEQVLVSLVGKIKQASEKAPSLCLNIPIDEDGFISLSDMAITTLRPSGLASATVMFNLGTKSPRFVIGSHDPSQGELLAALIESANASADAWVIEQPNAVEAIFALGPLVKAAIASGPVDGRSSRELTIIGEVQTLLRRYMRYNKEPSCCRLIPQIVHYMASEPAGGDSSGSGLSTLCLARDFLTFVHHKNLTNKVPELTGVACDILEEKYGLKAITGPGEMYSPAATRAEGCPPPSSVDAPTAAEAITSHQPLAIVAN
ncbi:hypothetical protein FOL47_008779 [Perkinsus chesapeaki]|uniref:Uncharacterized protein n=1 Tax=Perkinsus chesapeaki TaxID=330153 RepID=A0A7J6MT12_PERCH|nr:hypothetical protein FOL47_008779 [Perkinsus chesapeaki]